MLRQLVMYFCKQGWAMVSTMDTVSLLFIKFPASFQAKSNVQGSAISPSDITPNPESISLSKVKLNWKG